MYLMNSIQLCIVSFIVFQHYHVERGFVSDIKWYLYIEPDVASHTGCHNIHELCTKYRVKHLKIQHRQFIDLLRNSSLNVISRLKQIAMLML